MSLSMDDVMKEMEKTNPALAMALNAMQNSFDQVAVLERELDNLVVPRRLDDKELTLWGRVKWAIENLDADGKRTND